jgi:hypothetical protein
MSGSYAREQLQDKTSSRNVYKEITYSWMARVLGFRVLWSWEWTQPNPSETLS